jgi:hypothetical protein
MNLDDYRLEISNVYGNEILGVWESLISSGENHSPMRALALAKSKVYNFSEKAAKIEEIHFNGSGFFNPLEEADVKTDTNIDAVKTP